MKTIATRIGNVVIIEDKLAVIDDGKNAIKGSVALCMQQDVTGGMTAMLIWQWGADWCGYYDGQEHNAEEIDLRLLDALESALTYARERYTEDVMADLDWFAQWASAARATLAEQAD